jgi:iron-sulfur cluster assembly protein
MGLFGITVNISLWSSSSLWAFKQGLGPRSGFAAFGYFCSMETTITTPVTLTAGAIREIKKLMGQEGFDSTQVLRVGVKGGGCSGMSYILGFDHKQENDQLFEIEGIPCAMNRSHEIYLYGMQVDWIDGLNNRGFTFSNPNASNTCGCGTSFAV